MSTRFATIAEQPKSKIWRQISPPIVIPRWRLFIFLIHFLTYLNANYLDTNHKYITHTVKWDSFRSLSVSKTKSSPRLLFLPLINDSYLLFKSNSQSRQETLLPIDQLSVSFVLLVLVTTHYHVFLVPCRPFRRPSIISQWYILLRCFFFFSAQYRTPWRWNENETPFLWSLLVSSRRRPDQA